MKLWKVSPLFKRRELFGLTILLFCTFAVVQIFSVRKHRVATRTELHKPVEDELTMSKKIDEEHILQFQPVADIVLPTSHSIQLSGLQRLPDKFLTKIEKRYEPIHYRLQPGRIVGENGLLVTREFQGNTWLGTLMKGAVVFFIQSATGHLRRRMLVRETWASIRDIDGWKIEVVFVLGWSDDVSTRARISLENKKYGDILQYQGADRLRYSTMKVLAGMHWALSNLPGDFFYAFASDDTLVNIVVVRDFLSMTNPHCNPPGQVYMTTAVDGSTVTSCQQQKIYCFETFHEQEVTERNLDLARSVDTEVYDAQFWPPYCTEGLYILPVSFAKELYEESRHINATLPHKLHDVFITGILRRKINRGDNNIHSANTQPPGTTTMLRFEELPRSNHRKLAHYEVNAEAELRSTWKTWYKLIRYRFHIFTNLNKINTLMF